MFIERDGARLFSAVLGDGPDLVLLHPTPVHHGFWLPLANLLAVHYRLTLVDLRGHGQSTAGSGPITMLRLAEDVHAILAATGVRRAVFVGCSIGGYLLYEYWRRFPQQVAALVPICGKPQADSAENLVKRQQWMRTAQQPGGLKKNFDTMANTLVGHTARERDPGLSATVRSMMEPVTLAAALAVQLGLMERPDSVPTLKTISVPVCAIAGGEDEVNTPVQMQVVADQAPDSEFHLLPDAGHYAPVEQPDTVARIVKRFLQGHARHTLANTTSGSTH